MCRKISGVIEPNLHFSQKKKLSLGLGINGMGEN